MGPDVVGTACPASVMLPGIDRVQGSDSTASTPALRLLRGPSRSQSSVAIPPVSAEALTVAASHVAEFADPLLLLQVLCLRARNNSLEQQSGRVKDAQRRTETLAEKRQQALEAARKAAEEASTFLGLPKIVGDVIKVVAVAAAVSAVVATSVLTGGAAAPLLVAGLVLMLSADTLAEQAVKAGVISESDAAMLATGFRVVGALLMTAGGGLAGAGAGATSGAQAVQTTGQVAEAIQGATGAIENAGRVHTAVHRHDSQRSELAAERVGLKSEKSQQDAEDAVDTLGEQLRLFQRVAARLQDAAEVRNEVRLSCLRELG